MRLFSKTLIALSLSALCSGSFIAHATTTSQDAELTQATAQVRNPQDRSAEFAKWVDQRLNEYETWREDYTRDLDHKRQQLIDQWGSAQISDATTDVEYSTDSTVRKVVDYQDNTATVSVLVDASMSDEQAKQLLLAQTALPDGETADLNQATLYQQSVKYSGAEEKRETDFVLSQTRAQMNEFDVQAERLVMANIGISDQFIYQRAYIKKLALIDEAKLRVQAIREQYRAKRAELGIPEPERTTSEPTKSVVQSDPVSKREAVSKHASVSKDNAAEKNTAGQQNNNGEQTERQIATVSTQQPETGAQQATASKASAQAAKAAQTQSSQPNEKSQPAAKKIVSYKISLPNNSLTKRAQQYQPIAQQESEKFSVNPALVMAIMHSESAFRPEAKSHVPAFGLMQIVPTTAGHDVNLQVRNIDAPMREAELYQPPVNVETGTAYLHILDSKYLKNIKDEQSRLYCTIAAYNTGAGNVARAFNPDRSTNIRKAATTINQLTPQQVYQQLMTNLPYDETKNYLKKVSARIALYQPQSAL